MLIKPNGSSNISRYFSIYIIFSMRVDRRHSCTGTQEMLPHNKKGEGGRAESVIARGRAQVESNMVEKRPRHGSEVDPTTKKKPGHSAEGLLAKKESDRQRRQTRICIGVAFPRWRALKEEIGLRADTHVALLLLDK
ncbi:hypothetical protein P7M41_25880 [Vibrio parahaemolyticus]|nr:hypothetical protein [Vibrio parahaemolyticus]